MTQLVGLSLNICFEEWDSAKNGEHGWKLVSSQVQFQSWSMAVHYQSSRWTVVGRGSMIVGAGSLVGVVN